MRKALKKKAIWIILVMIIAIIIASFFIYKIFRSPSSQIECKTSEDCVPSSCCHSSSCVAKSQAPDCKKTICTQVCAEGTLDCGQGSCACVNKRCSVVPK